ncbi:complement C1q-like protein 3 [Saccostrea echinata]|uniref:complement C1q-like protein 3 n=1 Tax=Saccostrea echinata TaxID=191078 RepID=UPI002A8335C9|nr:complement C1q-like protein 3 [Saccostrea echinata]
MTNLRKNTIVVFGAVTLNSGNAYDSTTGKFTAPDDGIYSFMWTILTKGGNYFNTKIVLNGNFIGYNYADGVSGSSNWASGSSSAVIKMRKNDKVWISTYSEEKYAYSEWSSFSGFRL